MDFTARKFKTYRLKKMMYEAWIQMIELPMKLMPSKFNSQPNTVSLLFNPILWV